MKLRHLVFAFQASFLILALGWADGNAPDWEAAKEKDGIKVSSREVPGTPLVEVKGEALIEAPLGKVAWILLDCARAQEWVQSLDDCRVLEQSTPFDRVTYNHFGTPFIIKDRDFVTSVKSKVLTENNHKVVHIDLASIDFSAAPTTKYVRGQVIRSSYHMTETDKGTILVAQALVDPKGTVPKWIVNFFQKQWPIKSMQALRKQAAKSDVIPPGDLLGGAFSPPSSVASQKSPQSASKQAP